MYCRLVFCAREISHELIIELNHHRKQLQFIAIGANTVSAPQLAVLFAMWLLSQPCRFCWYASTCPQCVDTYLWFR